jgi:hypothetical protein
MKTAHVQFCRNAMIALAITAIAYFCQIFTYLITAKVIIEENKEHIYKENMK